MGYAMNRKGHSYHIFVSVLPFFGIAIFGMRENRSSIYPFAARMSESLASPRPRTNLLPDLSLRYDLIRSRLWGGCTTPFDVCHAIPARMFPGNFPRNAEGEEYQTFPFQNAVVLSPNTVG